MIPEDATGRVFLDNRTRFPSYCDNKRGLPEVTALPTEVKPRGKLLGKNRGTEPELQGSTRSSAADP